MEAIDIAAFLRSMGEPEMAREVEAMANRLEPSPRGWIEIASRRLFQQSVSCVRAYATPKQKVWKKALSGRFKTENTMRFQRSDLLHGS